MAAYGHARRDARAGGGVADRAVHAIFGAGGACGNRTCARRAPKGASWPRRIRWHALPNAAIPTLTVLGFQFGLMIAGTVVIETVFAWPGMGRLFYQAVNARDYAVVQTIILLIAVSIILINLMVDLLYAVLDPRVRLTGSN